MRIVPNMALSVTALEVAVSHLLNNERSTYFVLVVPHNKYGHAIGIISLYYRDKDTLMKGVTFQVVKSEILATTNSDSYFPWLLIHPNGVLVESDP